MYLTFIGNTDNQLGPVVVFGTGGKLVEVYKDRALGLPPLNASQAYNLMAQTKIFKALKGFRDFKPVDMDKLCSLVMCFGDLLVSHPFIKVILVTFSLLISKRNVISILFLLLLPGLLPSMLELLYGQKTRMLIRYRSLLFLLILSISLRMLLFLMDIKYLCDQLSSLKSVM